MATLRTNKPAASQQNDNVSFMTIAEFKTAVGADTLQVLKNPKTDKLFLSSGSQNWRVQGDLDPSEKMAILVEDNDLENACLVNTTGGAEVLATL